MTKEHIFPSFLYRQFPDHKFGYNPRADRFLTCEAQIRDVCQRCNNGTLSELDAYAKRFLTSIACEQTYRSRTMLNIV